jgi:hypothetical protein
VSRAFHDRRQVDTCLFGKRFEHCLLFRGTVGGVEISPPVQLRRALDAAPSEPSHLLDDRRMLLLLVTCHLLTSQLDKWAASLDA